MNTRSSLSGLRIFAIVILAAFATFAASAADGGHGGGGSHAAASGGGGRAGYGFRGGYGYRGGWRGYGYYGGWGRWGGWGGWGWGGLGYGLFFGALPFYYSTLWWDGVPYYYAAGDYYMWNGAVGEYETVRPPPGLESQVAAQDSSVTNLFAYPKNGQSAEQQARDRYECHRWAIDQTGFDPTQPGGVAAADSTKPGAATPAATTAEWPAKRQEYVRAQTACLEGRGYSVR
ncbi:MAG: hypothetical protein ABSF31_08940 [Steroidobacteraceae bacterium]|jgi:hypothetical protein